MKRSTAIVLVSLIVLVATGAGYLFGSARSGAGGRPNATGVSGGVTDVPPIAKQVYTCSMHPQVRLDQPGNCPICEMPLIPAASATTASGEAPMLQLSEHAVSMASVETVAIERRPLSRDLRAVGRIEYNESSLATITPRVDGFAERLFVSFTGVEIRKGDHLAEVYSPELLVAQQELLIALQAGVGGGGNSLAEVAKTKLRLLGLTEQQVTDLVEKKQTTDRVTLYSPISGTVIEKSIVEKASFKAGDALYRIANLDSVWVYLEIYEYDLPWVRYGQQVRITAQAIPGRTFDGVVTFVQPVVNEQSRTVRVPVYVDNKDHALKPGMFVTALIAAELTSEGRAAATGVEGRYSCPMHPQVLADAAGECPICQMPLEKIPDGAAVTAVQDQHAIHDTLTPAPVAAKYYCPMKCEGEKTYDQPGRCPVCNMKLKEVPVVPAATAQGSGVLAVPVSAVLDSGTRQIVYIEKSRGLFEPRELTLGPRAGEYFAVLAGLAEGERVVTRGNFLIDSQFQVTGHPSLFYPGGLHASMGHQHAGTAAPGGPNASTPPAPSAPSGDKSPQPVQSPAGHKH
ncbi:MAG: efflux RND transporter periplasmic adaptor subunit [Planctomycetes bacterium]|nr:efflux RND transporter periplasmic adaptor subunit [Planctomycetota bacterium]